MAAQRIIGSKELDSALNRPGSQSSWTYPAAIPSKNAIKNMEKRATNNQQEK